MRRSFSQGLAIGIFVLFSVSFSLRAQEPQATLDLQTQSGQTTFHIGERIPLKLIYNSSNDTEYIFDRWGGIGRACGSESVNVSPATGWSDPYFAQNFVCAGSGPAPQPLLKAKPVELTFDLNQWVRFDAPGVYKVKVDSHRVIDVSGAHWIHIPLQSNLLELHIIAATREWQESLFKSVPSRPEADRRYLATPAAIDEMITPSLDEMGLLGLPDSVRATAIESMNKRIDDPDYAITSGFLDTLARLHVTPGSNSESIRQQIESTEAELWAMVLAAAKEKKGAAQAQTVQTLFESGRFTDKPEAKTEVAQLLRASFLDLSPMEQVQDLRQKWDALRSPGILPLLGELAKLPAINEDQNSPFSRMDLKSAALMRWYELDPAGARREILAQIGSSDPSLSAGALTFMPPERLHQFEGIWAQVFVDTMNQLQEETVGSLLVRFGTGAAKRQMLAKLKELPGPTCASHAFALAYLVRFSPKDARPLLEHELHEEPRGCKGTVLQLISRQATRPVMNDVAVDALNTAGVAKDSDAANDEIGVIRDSLAYLTSYGRPSDEKPIWDRYVKWSQTWTGKVEVLANSKTCILRNNVSNLSKDVLAACQDAVDNEQIGVELGKALIANQGWFADQALIDRVLDRCRGEYVCKQLKDVAASAAPPYYVDLPDASGWNGGIFDFSRFYYRVAQYAPKSLDLFEVKIRQYPPGTKFLVRQFRQASDQQKLEETVRAILRKYGMVPGIWTP